MSDSTSEPSNTAGIEQVRATKGRRRGHFSHLSRYGRSWLALVLLALVALVIGGHAIGGTFASSFSGEDTYNSSTFSASTLNGQNAFTATPSGNSVSLAWSYAAGSPINGTKQFVNEVDNTSSSSCSSSSTFANLAEEATTVTTLTDTNRATASGVDAGDNVCYQVQDVYAATVSLTTALTTTPHTTSLAVGALIAAVASGDAILVTSGTHTQSFTASAAAAIGATSISVTSVAANFAYPVGSMVTDTTSWASWTASSYANTQVGFVANGVAITNSSGMVNSGDTVAATFNQQWTTAPAGGNVCVIGSPTNEVLLSDTTTNATNGACSASDTVTFGTLTSSTALTAAKYTGSTFSTNATTHTITITIGSPPTVNLTTALVHNANTTSLKVSALTAAVASGNSIVLTSGANTQTFTASAAAAVGATTIDVTGAAANFAYPTTTTVNDSTTNWRASVSGTPTWTFTPASSLKSSTGAVSVCTSNAHASALCQPTTTTSF